MKKILRSIAATFLIGAGSAQATETLSVYSYRQPFLVEHLFDQFEAESGVKIEVLYAKKGLIERLKLEGAKSPADILLSSNSLRLLEAKEAGLTQAIEKKSIIEKIPSNLRDPEQHWLGLTRRGRVLYANQNTVPDDALNDYMDILESDYRVCLRPWRHPYNVSLVAYLIESIGETATENWIKGVQSRLGRKPQGNDRAQIRAVNAGECDIAIANSYYFGVMKADPKQIVHTKNVRAIFPTLDQKHGTFGFISGIALLKSTDNVAEAEKLIDFMVSAKAQKIYAKVNHEFPASAQNLDAGPDEAKLDSKPMAQVFSKRAVALDLINRIVN